MSKTVVFAWFCEECGKTKQIEIPVGDDYRGFVTYLMKGYACALHNALFSWWDQAKEVQVREE